MFKNKKTVVSVSSMVFIPCGDFLVVKRADDDSRPGMWELPGGKLEFGEDPKKGVIREVKEETNLDIKVVKPLYVIGASNKEGKHMVYIVFMAGLKDKVQTVKLSHEHSAYDFVADPFGIQDASSIMYGAYIELVKEFQTQANYRNEKFGEEVKK